MKVIELLKPHNNCVLYGDDSNGGPLPNYLIIIQNTKILILWPAPGAYDLIATIR